MIEFFLVDLTGGTKPILQTALTFLLPPPIESLNFCFLRCLTRNSVMLCTSM
jgi:hypothetical protein